MTGRPDTNTAGERFRTGDSVQIIGEQAGSAPHGMVGRRGWVEKREPDGCYVTFRGGGRIFCFYTELAALRVVDGQEKQQ